MKKFALIVAVTCITLSACKETTDTLEMSDALESHTSTPEESTSELTDATEAQIIEIETLCEEQKQQHIVYCDSGPLEDDLSCRTTLADRMYRECVASLILKDMLGEDFSATSIDTSIEASAESSVDQY